MATERLGSTEPAAVREEPEAEGGGESADGAFAGEERRSGSRAPQFVRRSRTLHLSWRVGIFVVGLAVVAAGAAMLVLPGPGWLVIFAGIGVWSTEFPWALRVLRWTKEQLQRWTRRIRDRRDRRRAARAERERAARS